MCGTKDYLAPELLRRNQYDSSVDNWCVGVLCFELLSGNTPFHTERDADTTNNIGKVRYSFPSYFEEGAKDVIGKLLKFVPTERLSLEDVVKHPWIQRNGCNLPNQSWKSKGSKKRKSGERKSYRYEMKSKAFKLKTNSGSS